MILSCYTLTIFKPKKESHFINKKKKKFLNVYVAFYGYLQVINENYLL